MYLKTLEMVGFKSFANRTKLEFEPGMIAIVGPNGCGKSNVSDAIRWVLGEQRPTALRGSKMQDVIFNGTDGRKPLGMAEVNITFADCEGVLQTEYNEVTVSRRVFRTGEGSYFINKTPCRLRDIQRLFMGTGIGTTSYSVMAQGQIDAILSSKPEDRRAVFEEAAGITKFKADRKDAMRKLEQTDANLLRIADVIRESRRQIGSLQRQVGKARRYKELREELRGLDLFVTKRRLAELDGRLGEIVNEATALSERIASGQDSVAAAEAGVQKAREDILDAERKIGALTEAAAQAEGRLRQARQMIQVNEQRVAEYQGWSERDTREIAETTRQIGISRDLLAQLMDAQRRIEREGEAAAEALEAAQDIYEQHKAEADASRAALQQARSESVEIERRCANLQNQISALEYRQRETILRRERLSAERDQLAETLATIESSRETLSQKLEERRAAAEVQQERLETLEGDQESTNDELAEARKEAVDAQSQLAARSAQLDLLTEQEESHAEFQAGSRLLLDSSNPLGLAEGAVLGPLADRFKVDAEFRPALESALRAWIDAVVVGTSADAATVIARLAAHGDQSSARLVVAAGAAAPAAVASLPLPRLLDRIGVADDFRDAAERLLNGAYLVDSLDQVPAEIPAGCMVVTKDGAVFRGDGCVELWSQGDQADSPLARRMAIADARAGVEELQGRVERATESIESLSQRATMLAASIADARRSLEVCRREAAQQEGELQGVTRDADRARQRHDVVAAEFEQLRQQTQGADAERDHLASQMQAAMDRRTELVDEIARHSSDLEENEARLTVSTGELTERRIRHANLAQQLQHAKAQADATAQRLEELDKQLHGRDEGVRSYAERIAELTADIVATRESLGDIEEEVASLRETLEIGRGKRAEMSAELDGKEAALGGLRSVLDADRERKAKLDLEQAEASLRRQNQLERIQNEYQLTEEQLGAEPDPVFNDEPPSLDDADARVAELSAAIQALGPVNLVAIEECKEQEERLAFLQSQEADLTKSKEQIMDLIRMINKKSSEMFRETFERANENFQKMFTKLFNGGTASLTLLEGAEDPLDCGVDIIARPPGKRPQSVSLLSGGERTMTAVSLLFAIYMIRPSPFCLLDELDAALDDSNIGRFVQALKDFLVQSQFLIITHSPYTIAGSDLIYGVTMPERGVSRMVSMRLREIGSRDLEVIPESEAKEEEMPAKGRRRRKAAKVDDTAPLPLEETTDSE